jgi:Rieske Fe-S protein
MAIQQLSRRSLLNGAAICAGAAVAGFVVARARRPDPASTGAANAYGAAPADGKLLAALDNVPSGGGLVLQGQRIVLTRGPGDTVHAFSAVCPHQGCLVASVAKGAINCPCHGSRFDAQTGARSSAAPPLEAWPPSRSPCVGTTSTPPEECDAALECTAHLAVARRRRVRDRRPHSAGLTRRAGPSGEL